MRESLAAALRGNLEHDARRDEPPVTRLGALAAAPRFSSLLLRLKHGLDAKAFEPAQRAIAARLPRRYPFGLRLRVADCALREWVVDGCRVCMGAGTTMLGARKVHCSACGGTGKHRYSDHERSTSLSVEDGARFGRLLSQAHRIIVTADAVTVFVARRELERAP